MKRFMSGFVLLAAAAMASCTTVTVPMTYDQTRAAATKRASQPFFEVGIVDDQRKVDSHWLGAIRGSLGNAGIVLQSEPPVSELVKTVFNDGLTARGLRAQPGKAKATLAIVIKKLDCSQYMRREAHVDLNINLMDAATSTLLVSKPLIVDRVTERDLWDFRRQSQINELRDFMNATLQETVDKALDDPDLLAKLKGRP